ncbi:MAG: hypothetical protein KatS3mg084_0503 [Candidatus Dojkabacteria bacterium]|nr:MAG: hypothetical protein KatS3mg084_0503 [Candidatus Dojkabacteria bacterium]
MDVHNLSAKTLKELKEIAKSLKILGISKKTKTELIKLISQKYSSDKSSTKDYQHGQKEQSSTKQDSESKNSKSNSKIKKIANESDPNLHNLNIQKSDSTAKEAIGLPNESTSGAQESTQVSAENVQGSQTSTNASNNQTNNVHQSTQNNPTNGINSNSINAKVLNEPTVEVSGILEIMADGTHGVLRSSKLAPSNKDTYISISQVKKLKLRKGDLVTGIARLPKENERYYSLLWIKNVNDIPVDQLKDRPNFDELKPVYPNKQIKLECGQYPIANRIIDLLAPIGFGQRAMIVAPPKAGKTTLLKDIAKGINANHPEALLMVVLIGERPEEVTDIERSVQGIVYASNFDESPQDQVLVAELSLERAKRLVEIGHDVIILMDSLTRLARAYNVALPASGRTLSGGLDPVSLYPSKRFFGAARNFENGASLTIVATALVETGSKMDDVIFEEFKGTGNMELKLDRKMANKRNFPAIDLMESGTRNEELLLSQDMLHHSWKIRKMLEALGDDGSIALIDRMKTTKSNEEFLNSMYQY